MAGWGTGVPAVGFDGSRIAGHTFHPHLLDGRGAPVPAGPEVAARIRASVAEPWVPLPAPEAPSPSSS